MEKFFGGFLIGVLFMGWVWVIASASLTPFHEEMTYMQRAVNTCALRNAGDVLKYSSGSVLCADGRTYGVL